MSNEAIRAVNMVYANTTKHDWPEDVWDAICKAIAEAEKQDKFHENWQEIDCPACGTLAKAKFQFYTHPQPKSEQEPVAWLLESEQAVWFERTNPEASSALPNDVTSIPLYTHPQLKREWVGLTIDDILLIRDEVADAEGETEFLIDFARAIEAKLKGLNA